MLCSLADFPRVTDAAQAPKLGERSALADHVVYPTPVLSTSWCFAQVSMRGTHTNLLIVTSWNLYVDLVWALLVDMSLLCTFMLQHTVMARPVIKVLYNKLGLSIVERSVYNLTASLALQLLIQHWVALRDPVWRINTVEHNACWWMFAISHGYCWATIYLGSLTMDLSDGLHHSKCSLLVTLMARHRSRGLALPERWVYTISWNSNDKDQPMVSWWAVGCSPGNVSHGKRECYWPPSEPIEREVLFGADYSGESVTDGLENMDCGLVQAVGRVIGAAGASAEERYKGRLNSEAQHTSNYCTTSPLRAIQIKSKRVETDSDISPIYLVYYYLNGWDDPLTLKSSELQRLISHQRHPSFVSFFFIFWVHPYMSVDRLIMAVIMTLYMVCAWKVDDIDFEYQERQFQRKEIELSHVH
uniref:Nuclear envelope membrane protein n=1 Tax=Timema poppense TaxID=170557 RepID=A0A7R9GSW7_TIMPO|nr:unnamed protein product [Timema poppensis]